SRTAARIFIGYERALGCGEALRGSRTGPFRFDLAVLWGCRRHECVEQSMRSRGDLVDRTRECFLVRLRRLREAADLADELQRGVADLVFRCGRLEVEQGVNVSAHGLNPTVREAPHAASDTTLALDRQ